MHGVGSHEYAAVIFNVGSSVGMRVIRNSCANCSSFDFFSVLRGASVHELRMRDRTD